jgi:hypothetical protein
MMAQLLWRRPVQNPCSVPAATDVASLLEHTQGTCHRRTMGADEIRKPLVRERERQGDAIG